MNWVIILLRFLGHIPTFWLGAASSQKYHTVRRYLELIPLAPGSHLQVSIHIPAILASLHLWVLEAVTNLIGLGCRHI